MSKEAAMQMLQSSTPSNPNPAAPAAATPAGSPGLQPAPVEGAAPAAPAALESTRFAQLAKKEAELQKQRESFKAEQTQFMSERQKMVEIQKQLTTFNELKVKDPVAALRQIGFSEKDLFNFIAAQEDTSTPEQKAAKAANNEIQKFKDEQAKIAADATAKRNEQVLGQFRKDIASTIAADPDKYEYCNYNGVLANDLIEETVSAVLAADNELISVQEAIEMVESYYEEQDKAMSTLKKRQPKAEEIVAAAPAPEAPLKPQVSPGRPSAARTLSSKTAATVASTTVAPRNETPDQKKARLVSKYFGKPS